ncbi:MAG: hypothetical protein GY792_00225, partial [Gammaproteobacteria bacterium]|nr:hypothetical protein [Gammaproteobacteria bacterium]
DQTIKLWNIETGEPLATLFAASDNEWVCWTPQGYYAASAGGEKYIGWHINRGLEREALFYPVSVFRKQYLQPELVKRTIEAGNFQEALGQFNEKLLPDKKILARGGGPALPPTFTWRIPQKRTSETAKASVPIKVTVRSDSEITEVKLLVNARPIANIPPSGRDSDYYREIEYDVPLIEGRNGIAVFAANEKADVTSNERVVLYAPPGSKWWKPNLYMVSIGIADYPLNKLKLNYTDDDASAMSELFRKQEGKLFNKVVVKELYDRAATRVNIIDALEWLQQQTTQHDVAVIFIAAHGYNQKKNYYLLPVDGNPEKLLSTAVDWSIFVKVL